MSEVADIVDYMTDETRDGAARLLAAIISALVDWQVVEDEAERAEHALRALDLAKEAAESGQPVEEIIVAAAAMYANVLVTKAERSGRDPRDAALSLEVRLLHRSGDAAS